MNHKLIAFFSNFVMIVMLFMSIMYNASDAIFFRIAVIIGIVTIVYLLSEIIVILQPNHKNNK